MVGGGGTGRQKAPMQCSCGGTGGGREFLVLIPHIAPPFGCQREGTYLPFGWEAYKAQKEYMNVQCPMTARLSQILSHG